MLSTISLAKAIVTVDCIKAEINVRDLQLVIVVASDLTVSHFDLLT